MVKIYEVRVNLSRAFRANSLDCFVPRKDGQHHLETFGQTPCAAGTPARSSRIAIIAIIATFFDSTGGRIECKYVSFNVLYCI